MDAADVARQDLESRSSWRDDPAAVRPTVLVLGGFTTSPPFYGPFARELLERGAADVMVAPIWTPDWAVAVLTDMRRIVATARRALDEASERSARSALSAGAPVLVIGHSAGGLIARLLTSPAPFLGVRLEGRDQIGAIVTLGTPHRVAGRGLVSGHIERLASAFANEIVPGAFFDLDIAYVSVASRSVVARSSGFGRARIADPPYRWLHPGPLASVIEGDGIVPVDCCELAGARHVLLEGAIHGPLAGRWYGSRETIDSWWPVALEAWRGALQARANGPAAKPARRRRAPLTLIRGGPARNLRTGGVRLIARLPGGHVADRAHSKHPHRSHGPGCVTATHRVRLGRLQGSVRRMRRADFG